MTAAGGEPHNYVCVFYADPAVQDDVVDLGLDPDFSAPLPTWGICRPNLRRAVRRGSRLVFLGYYPKDRSYLLKGWFEVDETIGYEEALERFPNRRNVIVRNLCRAPSEDNDCMEEARSPVAGRAATRKSAQLPDHRPGCARRAHTES